MDYSTEEQLNILLASAAGMTAKRFDGLIARFGSAREVFRQVTADADAGIPARLEQDIRRAGSREQLKSGLSARLQLLCRVHGLFALSGLPCRY